MKMNARLAAAAVVMEVLLMGAAIHALDVCGVSLTDLMMCKPAVTPPPPPPPEPSGVCCAAVSKADLRCLCSYKSSPLLPSLGIDPDLALHLPAKCHLNKTLPC